MTGSHGLIHITFNIISCNALREKSSCMPHPALTFLCAYFSLSSALRQEHTSPTVGRLKLLERLRRGREQICLVCSAASEAFRAVQRNPTEHAKSEEEGRRTSEPLDSLIVCQLNGTSDWWCASETAQCVRGMEYCVRFVFLCTSFRHFLFSRFHVLQYWHETSCYVRLGEINLCPLNV